MPQLRFRVLARSMAACTLVVLVGVILVGATVVGAQGRRPQAQVVPTVETTKVAPGGVATLTLAVKLPQKVHVQSDKPKDPLFIPTVLTVNAPAGVTVQNIAFPPSQELRQTGLKDPLVVFGSEFLVRVRVKLAPTVKPGDLVVPGQLRYQACDDTTCYPPAKIDTSWTLAVGARSATPARRPRAS